MTPQEAQDWEDKFVRDVNQALQDSNADYRWIDELPEDPGVPESGQATVVEIHEKP